jgi:hypothetical protein
MRQPPLCPRHHHCKHEGGWTVHRRPDGVTEWTSPTGRTYEKPPDDWPDTDNWDGDPEERITAALINSA